VDWPWKNLGRWLSAAVRGENIGIISGADIIALRNVEVEPVEEYSSEIRAPCRALSRRDNRE
jgi:hypothetical protein